MSIRQDLASVSVRRSMVLLASGALLGLAIAGYGLFTSKGTRSHGVPPEAVALINQRPILRSDFMTQTQAEFAVPFVQTTGEQRRKVLGDMINEELLMQRGLEMDLPSYDPDVRVALVAGVELEVTADVLAQKPTPEQLRAYYEEHQDKYSSEGTMKLRDLLVRSAPSPAAAQEVALRAGAALRSGEPLEAVMKRFGVVDSGRFMEAGRVNTGSIFQFAVRAKASDALYEAILPLQGGQVSAPIVESEGVHLILMIERHLPVPQTLEEASDRLWKDVRSQALEKAKAANLSYLRARAEIVVAPDYAALSGHAP
jgi:parvulin-like peptidyl-prolyl isomerase